MTSIVINIGNTNIRFGHFIDGKCDVSWIINTKPYGTRDELFAQFSMLYQTYNVDVEKVDKIIIGSVVPQLTHIISSALYKIHGIALPRDADKQAELGEARDFVEESEPGDLAFFEDETGFISHVGLVLSPFELIHASGKVRIDSLDFSGIYNAEQNKHTHKLRFVKTMI